MMRQSKSKPTLKRRLFNTQAAIVTLFVALLGCSSVSMAEFEENKHYFKVENPKPGTGKKVDVVEFFNYACPHCSNIEVDLQRWLKSGKPDNVNFEHMPAFWNPLFENTAKAFYTAEALGEEEKMHQAIFDAIHKKRMDFSQVKVIKQVFVDQGIDGDAFDKQYTSFFVNQKINIANKMFADYKLRSVPTFVIDGQWRTSVQEAGSHTALFEMINYLTEKAIKSR